MPLSELYRTLQKDDLCLAYAGVFSDNMTDKLIDLSSVYLESNPELTKLRRRTSFLVAESFQNVLRHGSKAKVTRSGSLSSGSFIIRFRDNKCFIASRNAVPKDRMDDLQKKIQNVNSHDTNELKTIYKEKLKEGELSEKGGAGLGLIEMARKTENKLHYCFNHLDEQYCEFFMMLILEPKNRDAPQKLYISELNFCMEVFRKQEDLNQFLLYLGDFSDMVINPVIDVIKTTMDSISSNRVVRMKLYHAAIEMMHNINYYAYHPDRRKMGMITMGKQSEAPVISAHYNIRSSTKQKLERILGIFKNASAEDLDYRYSRKLKMMKDGSSSDNWIGLIELARISQHWEYYFEATVEDTYNLGFYVTI